MPKKNKTTTLILRCICSTLSIWLLQVIVLSYIYINILIIVLSYIYIDTLISTFLYLH